MDPIRKGLEAMKQHHRPAADGEKKNVRNQSVECSDPSGGVIYDTTPSTTPDEDRDWVPEGIAHGGSKPFMPEPVMTPELEQELSDMMQRAAIKSVRIVPPTPDLSGLKAALEGLREDWPVFFRERRLAHTSLHRLFLSAEEAGLFPSKRAGLLTEERPVDAVEVATRALEAIQRVCEDPAASSLGLRGLNASRARTALAALKGRGE